MKDSSQAPVTSSMHEQIRQLAYELWEAQGRPNGQSEEHWREAERRFANDATPAEGPTQQCSVEQDLARRMPPAEAAINARGEANGSKR